MLFQNVNLWKPNKRQRKSVTSLKSNKVGVEEKEKENTFPTPIIGSKAIQQKYAKNKDSDDEDEDEEAEWQKAGIHGRRGTLVPFSKTREPIHIPTEIVHNGPWILGERLKVKRDYFISSIISRQHSSLENKWAHWYHRTNESKMF